MAYVISILQKFARVRKTVGQPMMPKLQHVDEVECAFCHGAGINSKTNGRCPVCGGSGRARVQPPVLTCAFCHGEGVPPWSGSITCPVCSGKGAVSVKVPFARCPRCQGTGQRPTGRLYCLNCYGKGVVSLPQTEGRR